MSTLGPSLGNMPVYLSPVPVLTSPSANPAKAKQQQALQQSNPPSNTPWRPVPLAKMAKKHLPNRFIRKQRVQNHAPRTPFVSRHVTQDENLDVSDAHTYEDPDRTQTPQVKLRSAKKARQPFALLHNPEFNRRARTTAVYDELRFTPREHGQRSAAYQRLSRHYDQLEGTETSALVLESYSCPLMKLQAGETVQIVDQCRFIAVMQPSTGYIAHVPVSCLELDSEVPDDITATTEPEPAKSMQTQGTQTPFSSLKVDKALIEAAEALGITAGDEQAPLTEHLYLPINTDDHGELDCFHGDISREEATRRLNACGEEGHFLMRSKDVASGRFALSILSKGVVSHHLIQRRGITDYYVNKTHLKTCGSLLEVLSYLSDVSVKDAGLPPLLKHPLERTSIPIRGMDEASTSC